MSTNRRLRCKHAPNDPFETHVGVIEDVIVAVGPGLVPAVAHGLHVRVPLPTRQQRRPCEVEGEEGTSAR